MGLLIKLQNGDTALKSLKFGNDKPGGGDSGQPYIKNPIDRPDTPTLNSDFLLRGGISAPLNAAEDVARLTKYFFDPKNPSGILFTAKQNLLSRVSPKTEASFGLAYGNGTINAGVYTPLSTLAQAGVVAFGGHLEKQGLDPTGTFRELADSSITRYANTGTQIPEASRSSILAINKYQDVVYNNNREDKNKEKSDTPLLIDYTSVRERNDYLNNRSSYGTYMLEEKPISSGDNLYANRLLKLRDVTGLNPNSPSKSLGTLYSYKGGPDSIVGFGTTDIKFATGNDGRVALRTNNLRNLIGEYGKNEMLRRKNIYFQTGLIFGNLYSSKPGVSRLYESTFKPSTSLFEGGSYENYVKNHSGYESFQPWIQDFITPSGSKEDPYKYLTKKQHTPLSSEEFIQPIAASVKYNIKKNFQGDQVKYELSYAGKPYYEIDYNTSVYKSGSLEPRPNIDSYLTRSYDIIQRSNDELENKPYISPINKKLNEYDRQLVEDPTLQKDSGHYEAIDPKNKKVLGRFDPPLMDKMLKVTTSETWNYTGSKSHGDGYLANLDKNAGYYQDPNSKEFVFKLNQYTRGIAPDFRATDRKTRGFKDYISSKSNGYTYGGYDAITKDASNYGGKILDKVYYSSTDKRQSKELFTDYNDLIEFNFTILDPQNPSSPGTILDFRAYIDQFSDSYSNDWKSQTYMGRAEKQYKYNSFDRSISLGFTIVADNETNLKQMYSQLNTLASSIAPSYTKQGYMAGVLHKLTVGNYINRQPGILQGLTFEITDETPWQISKGSQLPLYIKVTGIKFIPIHVFRPEVILDSNLTSNSGGEKYNVPISIDNQRERYIYQSDGKPNN